MNKYLRAVLFNSIFFILNTVFYLVITAIALRVMGEEFFGLWMVMSAILLFSNVGAFGLGVVVNKYVSEVGEKALSPESIFSTGVFLVFPIAIIGAIGIILLRHWITNQLGMSAIWKDQFNMALIITAASIVPQSLSRVPYGYLLAQLRNDFVRGLEFSVNTFLWGGIVVLAFYTRNLAWMALWGLIIQGIGMVVLYLVVLQKIQFHWKVYPNVIRKMLKFSGFYFIESLAINLFQQFDRILTGFVLGPAAAGVYAVATSVGLRVLTITGQVTEVLVPYASRKQSLGEDLALYQTFRQVSQIMSVLAGLLASVLILWMDVILSLWISTEYADNNSMLFRLIVFAYFFISLARSGHQTLTGMGKVRSTSLIYLGTSIIMLLGVYLLANQFGLFGAASANFIMVLLFGFNILVYRAAHYGKVPWIVFITDNGLAMIFVSLIYGSTFIPFNNNSFSRVILTVILTALSLYLVARKSIIKAQIAWLYHKLKGETL